MTELEVEIKIRKGSTPEDEENIKLSQILGKNIHVEESEDNYEYRRLILDIDDIKSRLEHDMEHTVVFTPLGAFMIKMPYDRFNQIHEALTSRMVKKVSDFKFVEPH